MVHVKFHGATPRTDTGNLCFSCRHSQIMRTTRGQEQVWCHRFDGPFQIVEPIEQCNKYKRVNEPTVQDYTELAWIINPDRPGKAGFMNPKEYAKRVKDGKDDELEVPDPINDHRDSW